MYIYLYLYVSFWYINIEHMNIIFYLSHNYLALAIYYVLGGLVRKIDRYYK